MFQSAYFHLLRRSQGYARSFIQVVKSRVLKLLAKLGSLSSRQALLILLVVDI